MNTQSSTAGGRRWWVAATFLAASWVALPTLAATCNPNGFQVNPKTQSVQEFNAGSGYTPTLVNLGVNKTASQIASAVADGVQFNWTQIATPPAVTVTTPVTLANATTATPSFLTPGVTASTTLTFRLTTSCVGGGSSTDTGTVTVVNTNRPPAAYASATPLLAYPGDSIALHSYAPAGTPVSGDQDGDAISYLWTRTAGPAVTLVNPNSATASFVAPPAPGSYSLTFQLRVSDPAGLFNTTSVVVNVTADVPPIARLACPETVAEGGHAVLDGSTSTPGSGGALAFAWTQLQGSPSIVVGNATGSTAEFDAPPLTASFNGLLLFQLHVSNAAGEGLATCAMQIVDVTDPVITVPDDITVEATSNAGEPVSFSVVAQDAAEDDVPYELLTCEPPSGSLFQLAAAPIRSNATTVICAASDLAGNTAAADFDVIVQDMQPPLITVPGAFALEATGPDGAVAEYSATKEDAVDGPGDADCVPASGSTFALGTTSVTCTATDARTNAADPESFNLTVHDTTKPIVTVPADIVAEAESALGAAVTFSVTAFDIVDLAIPATCDANSGDVFPLGETTVHCSATDAHLNTGTASFKITVRDTTKPTLSLPSTITEEATSPDGAVVGYLATATDTVDPSVDAVCEPPSGSTFALGTTTVECTATDGAGNTAEGSFDVIVKDNTPPTLSELLDITIEATGPAGAAASWIVSASDLVSGDVDVTCDPTSGSTFDFGTTTVECNATDDANNTATDTFTVTVRDTTPPTLSLPTSLSEEATGPNGATVTFTATASDIVSGSVPVTCTPTSGSVFALGQKLVQCSAKDAANNEASGAFTVTVVDTQPPTLVVPADKIVEATSPSGATVSFTTSATDIVDTNVDIVCTPPSGSTFALGSHTVSCTATDDSGNQDTDSFNVLVRDTTAPVLHLPASFTKEATSSAGAVATFTATADDVVDTSVIPACVLPSGSTFALGANTVSCTATDESNNSTSGSFTITVVDTTAPVVASHADVIVTAPSNSSAIATWTDPTASDAVDGNNLATTCVLPSGSLFSVGATNLITCSVTDQAGNTGSGTFNVIVKYAFAGFFSPVDNLPIVNTVKSGQAIPLKFSLGGNQGLSIFYSGYPKSIVMPCGGSAQDAIEETLTAGNSTLTYDVGTARYHYVWKTDKAWAGTCRQLQIKFADGTTQIANFNFTR